MNVAKSHGSHVVTAPTNPKEKKILKFTLIIDTETCFEIGVVMEMS